MRSFKNKESGEVADQIGESSWYQIITSYPGGNYQLPIWVLNEDGEFSKTPWEEIK